jgi:hypothetical protein
MDQIILEGKSRNLPWPVKKTRVIQITLRGVPIATKQSYKWPGKRSIQQKTPRIDIISIGMALILFLLAACTTAGATPSAAPASDQTLLNPASPGINILNETPSPQPVRTDSTETVKTDGTAAYITPETGFTASPTVTPIPVNFPGQIPSTLIPTPRTSPPPDTWMSYPVTPTVSDTARQIYQHGQQMGRNPHAFSKIGDCQSITTYFLADFEHPGNYRLGEYDILQQTIDWFSGSFARESLSVKGGFNAAAVLSPLRADRVRCKSGESPLACEIRVNNPSIAIISLEEWWSGKPENYEKYFRQIIEYVIQQGVVPIVATKADNLEGNHLINKTITRLAWEYDIPLWNFWAAVQPLPSRGLLKDGFHLTHGNNYFFDDPKTIKTGVSVRNLTALQALDAVWRILSNQ